MMFLCVMLLIFSGFMDTISVNFTVVGPAAPLVVEAGKDLVLPCSLQPRISAVDMMVEWIRTDQSDSINVVHLYEDYKDRIYEQMESYKGRTALFKDEMLRGNTSLKLSAVQPSDEGAYKCVIQYRSWNGAIPVYVEVIENFKIVGATAPLIAEAGEDLVLPCSIKPSISAEDATVEWTRMHLNDRLVHFYKDFKDKNDDQMKSYRGRTALFKEELKKGNASLKLSALRLSDAGTYKCYIESIFWKDGIIVYLEVKGKHLYGWTIAIICISVFVIILVPFTAYLLQDKSSKKKLSSAQCSYITYMRLQSQHVRKELNLKKYNTLEEGFIRLIPAITKCRKAQFSDCNLTASSIKLLSAALQTDSSALKELDLSSNDLFDSGMEILSTGLKSPPCKLETLRIVKCKLSNSSCDALRSVLQASSSLKVLDLSENDLQDSGIELLSDGFKSLHCKLEILRLILCNLGRKTCEYLGSALQSKTCPLKELDLSKNNLQDAGMKTLSAGLESPQCKLEILRLAICNFTTKSCKSLISALRTKCFLKELDLCNNELQDSVGELLSAGLKTGNWKLEILRLAMCDIGIKTCENLEIALKQKNCCLKELDLSNNDLQDSGVKKLSDGLKSSHCKLEIVRLSGCMITEEGCCSLALALTSNPSCLNELDVTYNHTGASGVRMLTARLKDPQCLLTTLRMEHGGEIRIKPGLKKYYCDLTLDPNTAHRYLSLSDGNRKVHRVGSSQSDPDHPERFSDYEQVLCTESLPARCYWEVEWCGDVDIAVTYESINRKGRSADCVFGQNVKSWILFCSKSSYSVCHNNIRTASSAHPSSSRKVGVYVDCPAGTLSFYSISSDTHTLTRLHTFYTTFTEPLCAGFRLYNYNTSVRMCETE